MTLENSLANYSFLTLLVSMVFYWIETSFTNIPTFTWQKKMNFSFAKTGIFFSNFLLGLLLLIRWVNSGHFPLSNLYESLMFLSWCFTGLYILAELYLYFLVEQENRGVEKTNEIRKILGSITTPSALLTNAFATFTLPKEMQEASPLVPALQSNWLMMHVTVMILSYAALILGSLMSIAFLILTTYTTLFSVNNKNQAEDFTSTYFASEAEVKAKSKAIDKSNFAFALTANQFEEVPALQNNTLLLILDNLSYRILGIGFPLLTIGILSGAVWANEAWGSYWSWDPKETWALLTWLIFAIYLHTRISKGWVGKKPAIIASFGFLIVWVCYLGVNLIGEGLHSYGWISN